MKKILMFLLSIIVISSINIGLVGCVDDENQKQEDKEFVVLDATGNVVESSDSTWLLDREMEAVKIIGNSYTLTGKSEYPIYVENEEVSFITWKDFKIDSNKGFGFSVWNNYGINITLVGNNYIIVDGYSKYLKDEKQTYGNIGIDMGADLTFIGDGNLNINCKTVVTDTEIKKAYNCGIYSSTTGADLSISTNGKISIVIEEVKGTTATNALQAGILSDLSIFRMVSGEVDIDIKSSLCSNAEVNAYGVFGILGFDGGKISINVDKISSYKLGEALALFLTQNFSEFEFVVENSVILESELGHKFVQKNSCDKLVVSQKPNIEEGETLYEDAFKIPGSPQPDQLPFNLEPPTIISVPDSHGTGIFIFPFIKEIINEEVDDNDAVIHEPWYTLIENIKNIFINDEQLYGTLGLDTNKPEKSLVLMSIIDLRPVALYFYNNEETMPSVQVIVFFTQGDEKYEDSSIVDFIGGHLFGIVATPHLVEPIFENDPTNIKGDGECFAIVWGPSDDFPSIIGSSDDLNVAGGKKYDPWEDLDGDGFIDFDEFFDQIVGMYNEDKESYEGISDDELTQAFIKSRIVTQIALKNLNKITSNEDIIIIDR